MKASKIRVANEAESKEAQELFLSWVLNGEVRLIVKKPHM